MGSSRTFCGIIVRSSLWKNRLFHSLLNNNVFCLRVYFSIKMAATLSTAVRPQVCCSSASHRMELFSGFRLVLAAVLLATVLTHLTAGSAVASYSVHLKSPAPLSGRKTFRWSVGGVADTAEEGLRSVQLSGCWVSSDITLVSALDANAQPVTVTNYASGSLANRVVASNLKDRPFPITISMTFRKRFGTATVGTSARVKTISSTSDFIVGGPTCRAPMMHGAEGMTTYSSTLTDWADIAVPNGNHAGVQQGSYTLSATPGSWMFAFGTNTARDASYSLDITRRSATGESLGCLVIRSKPLKMLKDEEAFVPFASYLICVSFASNGPGERGTTSLIALRQRYVFDEATQTVTDLDVATLGAVDFVGDPSGATTVHLKAVSQGSHLWCYINGQFVLDAEAGGPLAAGFGVAMLNADFGQDIQYAFSNFRIRQVAALSPSAVTVQSAGGRDLDALATETALVGEPFVVPNDFYLHEQWSLFNFGQPVASTFSGLRNADVHAPEAWSITTGSPDVVVVVINSGVAYDHPDLADRMWTNPGETGNGKETNGIDDDGNGFVDDWRGWDFIDNDSDPYDLGATSVFDSKGGSHGTAVASIIAAEQNNGIGMTGLSPDIRIMPLRATSNVLPDQAVANAIRYAQSAGAKVVNLSLATFVPGFGMPKTAEAIKQAPKVLFIASAGNSGTDSDIIGVEPCTLPYSNIICVGASDQSDELSRWVNEPGGSNWGKVGVDLTAPGSNILVANIGREIFFSDGFEDKLERAMDEGWHQQLVVPDVDSGCD